MGHALADARQLAKSVHTVVLEDVCDRSVQLAQGLCRVPIRLHAIRVRILFIEELRDLLEPLRDLKIDRLRHDDSFHTFSRDVPASSPLAPCACRAWRARVEGGNAW